MIDVLQSWLQTLPEQVSRSTPEVSEASFVVKPALSEGWRGDKGVLVGTQDNDSLG